MHVKECMQVHNNFMPHTCYMQHISSRHTYAHAHTYKTCMHACTHVMQGTRFNMYTLIQIINTLGQVLLALTGFYECLYLAQLNVSDSSIMKHTYSGAHAISLHI